MTTTTATTRTVTLTNDFHDTEVTLRLRARADGLYSVTRSQARRAWRELCGHEGCTCGDTFGARGGDICLYPQAETRDGYIVDVISETEEHRREMAEGAAESERIREVYGD